VDLSNHIFGVLLRVGPFLCSARAMQMKPLGFLNNLIWMADQVNSEAMAHSLYQEKRCFLVLFFFMLISPPPLYLSSERSFSNFEIFVHYEGCFFCGVNLYAIFPMQVQAKWLLLCWHSMSRSYVDGLRGHI